MFERISRRTLCCLGALLAGLTLVALPGSVSAQGKKSDSVVKVTASADKPTAAGQQTVTINLAIEKGWHIYANPVGLEDFADNQTVVKFTGKEAKIDYPAGKLEIDKVVGSYRVYEDKVAIKAVVKRGKDTGPLEFTVRLQACSSGAGGRCLLPATIKATVP
jgi:DsbC/DsbD-like thiol-disulfide interchange protein